MLGRDQAFVANERLKESVGYIDFFWLARKGFGRIERKKRRREEDGKSFDLKGGGGSLGRHVISLKIVPLFHAA